MKRFITIFFSVLFAMSARAVDYYESGNYLFSFINNTSISLHQYLGDGSSFTIPTTLDYSDQTYPVTKLDGPTGSSVIPPDCEITDIFIPSSITSISCFIRDNPYIKRIIVENGDNLTTCTQCTNYTSICNVDYIIVFNNKINNFYPSNWAGGKISFVGASITLKYFDTAKEDDTIKMFFRYIYKRYFNEEKFNYLITALKNRGTDIYSISEIKINNYKGPSDSYDCEFEFTSNPANELAFGAKVITGSGSKKKTYVSTNIPDKVNFTAPSSDITAKITYSRDNTLNWNSVCLPFDIKESIFGDDVCKIYTVSSATATEINLTRVEDEETVIPAGTPCFINSSAEEWNLSLSNVTISSNVTPKTIDVDNNWQVIGSFTTQTIGAGKYKLNGDGDAFGITTSDAATVMPFRCYIATTSSNTPARLNINVDEEASITLVPNDAAPQRVKLYDLMGRPQKEGAKGLFIKSTR
ncbi:MAG: hypothetical protein J5543_10730 [Bacteroidales bacterium]|nr:hypothetical protein [Bacteroidales bacterium]